MSRFFTAGDSSSESSSSDEEELYSGDENAAGEEAESSDEDSSDSGSEEVAKDDDSSDSDDGKTGKSRFLRDADSSDDSSDEDKVTVVKSAKDKRHEELDGIVKLIDNASKIGDWSTIASGGFCVLVMHRSLTAFVLGEWVEYIESVQDLLVHGLHWQLISGNG